MFVSCPTKYNVVLAQRTHRGWFSKSLWGSGLGVILRSLRNSPFVLQARCADRIYRQPSGSYALYKLFCMQRTRYGTHPGAPFAPDNPKPASQAFSGTLFVTGETRTPRGRFLLLTYCLLIAFHRHMSPIVPTKCIFIVSCTFRYSSPADMKT
ncbi:hypothetical protein Psch_02882 [Pelotomaculum schinkii]|uniref:Uncharacterized protein n=1 Tax=Pelotomaculum schinkii TaxID=78350 RepID=A0A4Y7RAX5_9FIRM|nr:hypothetical protein Psch_02882 [Pelotomaculum schinkii]